MPGLIKDVPNPRIGVTNQAVPGNVGIGLPGPKQITPVAPKPAIAPTSAQLSSQSDSPHITNPTNVGVQSAQPLPTTPGIPAGPAVNPNRMTSVPLYKEDPHRPSALPGTQYTQYSVHGLPANTNEKFVKDDKPYKTVDLANGPFIYKPDPNRVIDPNDKWDSYREALKDNFGRTAQMKMDRGSNNDHDAFALASHALDNFDRLKASIGPNPHPAAMAAMVKAVRDQSDSIGKPWAEPFYGRPGLDPYKNTYAHDDAVKMLNYIHGTAKPVTAWEDRKNPGSLPIEMHGTELYKPGVRKAPSDPHAYAAYLQADTANKRLAAEKQMSSDDIGLRRELGGKEIGLKMSQADREYQLKDRLGTREADARDTENKNRVDAQSPKRKVEELREIMNDPAARQAFHAVKEIPDTGPPITPKTKIDSNNYQRVIDQPFNSGMKSILDRTDIDLPAKMQLLSKLEGVGDASHVNHGLVQNYLNNTYTDQHKWNEDTYIPSAPPTSVLGNVLGRPWHALNAAATQFNPFMETTAGTGLDWNNNYETRKRQANLLRSLNLEAPPGMTLPR